MGYYLFIRTDTTLDLHSLSQTHRLRFVYILSPQLSPRKPPSHSSVLGRDEGRSLVVRSSCRGWNCDHSLPVDLETLNHDLLSTGNGYISHPIKMCFIIHRQSVSQQQLADYNAQYKWHLVLCRTCVYFVSTVKVV